MFKLTHFAIAGLLSVSLLGGCSGSDTDTTADTTTTRSVSTQTHPGNPGVTVGQAAPPTTANSSVSYSQEFDESRTGANATGMDHSSMGHGMTGETGDTASTTTDTSGTGDTAADTTHETAISGAPDVTGSGSGSQDNGTAGDYAQTFDDNEDMAATDNDESLAKNNTTGNANNGGKAGTVQGFDKQFAMDAAKGGMKEVQLGRLATQKGSNAEVKEFAQQMVTDHTKANDELKSLAKQQGLELPAASTQNANEHSQISSLSGAEFDRKYAAEMVKDHEKTVALFEKEANQGKNEQLRQWASDKLPTLRHHLEMAQDMQASLGGGNNSK